MPARALRHYVAANPAVANEPFAVNAAVAAARSIVGKAVATSLTLGAAQELTLYVGTSALIERIIVYINLGPGEVYTETGLVLLAGEALFARSSAGTANTLVVHLFGEEVDN